MPPEMEIEQVSKEKSDALLGFLVSMCTGPREAYSLLCTTIWRLNFDINDNPVSIDQVCEEVGISLRSITRHQHAAN